MTTHQNHQEFNVVFVEAAEKSRTQLLGPAVLDSLYAHLEKFRDIKKDELPYRLETLYAVLEHVFDVQGARTIGMRIIRLVYEKFDLEFHETAGHTVMDYVKVAKEKLAEQ